MRLVYVTSTLPCGLQETFLYPEIETLLEREVELLVVPMYPRGAIELPAARRIAPRSRVRPVLDAGIAATAARVAVTRPASIGRALRLLRARPGIAAKNLTIIPKALWLASLARAWRADHVHVHWIATSASLAWLAAETAGVPWSVTAHRWDLVEGNLIDAKLRRASFVRLISEDGRALLRRSCDPAGDRRVRVLHMGVRLPAPPESFPAGAPAAGPFVVLCPANLLPVKGHAALVTALSRLPAGVHVELRLAGDGPEEPGLRELARTLGVERSVSFLGRLPHDDVLRLYRDGEVGAVALASVDLGDGLREGIPVALVEAMAHGVPVVGTRCGGIEELLGGGAGLLVPQSDPDALAGAIARLATDREAAARLARAGRRRVEAEYDVGPIVERLIGMMRPSDRAPA